MDVDCEKLPKLNNDLIKWLYFDGWYDGQTSGVAMYNNKRYYIECFDENDIHGADRWYRKFVVINLSPECWAEEDKRHALFCEKVGTHFTVVGLKNEKHTVKPKSESNEFYEKYTFDKNVEIDKMHHSCPFIGWFEE